MIKKGGSHSYADFSESEIFNLIGPRAPVDGGHEALPDALNELILWDGRFFLFAFDMCDELSVSKD